MRYYSDELDKVFDTEEQLFAAENENKQKVEKAKLEAEKLNSEKSELMEKIKNANLEVKKAMAEWEDTKRKANELENEVMSSLEDTISDMMNNAAEKVDNAIETRDALNKEFSDRFPSQIPSLYSLLFDLLK